MWLACQVCLSAMVCQEREVAVAGPQFSCPGNHLIREQVPMPMSTLCSLGELDMACMVLMGGVLPILKSHGWP